MKISDEMLSAFLDAELDQAEMEAVRVALETNDELVMRMAELSEVDQWVVAHAQQIDQTDVPATVTSLARQIDAKHEAIQATKIEGHANKVVHISKWRKAVASLNTPYSLAAGVALVVTVGLVNLSQQGNNPGLASDVVAALDHSLSGDTRYISDGSNVTAQLSFANHQGQFCRQYKMTDETSQTSYIACKQDGIWQPVAQATAKRASGSNDYQTAASHKELDAAIDSMISGAPLDRTQEQQAIVNDWLNNKQ